MGRLTGRLFVGFTSLLISFIAYSSQIFIIWPWYGREFSIQLLTLLVPFNALVGMLWWNYYLCATTDPGRVPKGWHPDTRDSDGIEVKKLTKGPRYCRTCEAYKPPRAHHCRQCKRCVLRMDHHCPWVNNCVGHFNYGHFIRFLFYVDVACSYHVAMVTRRVFYYAHGRFWDEPSARELIFIVLNYATCIPVLLAVGGFSIYHFYAMMTNTTTIEGWEKDKAATLLRRGKIRGVKFPYSLGVRRNIESILGKNPLLWCCPSVPPGSGLKYPLADGHSSDEEAWPPKDPSGPAYVYPHMQEADDESHVLDLPSSPWTYENGSLNPNLQPSNALKRRKSPNVKISNVPPYHPDYVPPSEDEPDNYPVDSSDEDEYDEDRGPKPLVRRGSEGYEVHAIDRERMLQQWVESRVEDPRRYHRYVPEMPSESESEEEEKNEEMPLAKVAGKAHLSPTAQNVH